MAKANNTTSVMFFNVALMLSLLLIISMAEARLFGSTQVFGKKDPTPECVTVHGVVSGETCFSVTQTFNLTIEFFSSINPNLNCSAVFVGQWLCISGTVV
ncbi:Peptidoglycan-binding lysin domain-containing protein [Cinnamomum micranthum f. kanehirae]|uniref:Peptidoglycan-binding lysin domain-containing protein n=1 Tax=Cinnamomum micranthum f. kanehirae TaxID=337451 RepID=A0A443PR62_9MAGN|nr:Peptidoglycan-binding lysin domain-containing protein [Cinnamomum micranthum f. kanehirae]